MGTLDDFFGDGRTAEPECSYCGKSNGKLIVSVSDHYGPTHWHHAECKESADNPLEVKEALERLEADEATNADYNLLASSGYGYLDNSDEFGPMRFIFTGKGDSNPYADQVDY